MKQALKGVLRPFYRLVVRSAPFQRILHREVQKVLHSEPGIGPIVSDFVQGDYGGSYGINQHDREDLLSRFRHIQQNLPGGPGEVYYLILAKEILSVHKSVRGDLIECGCYKGKSTAFLSIVAEMVSRPL